MLWGGREGYETLLNTDMKRELNQLGRFLNMVVEHKHKIGFKGTVLIEPKPKEPTKHQYDFDVASIFGMLKQFGLENEVKINIEQNHAILAGHTFEHELALATALGIFGSIDINRGDYLLGWDTDQFAMNIPEMALACYYIFQAGGFTTGGFNFDAKIRRQSIDPDDLLGGACRLDGRLRPRPHHRREDDQGRRARRLRRRPLRRMGRQGGEGDPRRQALARRPVGLRAQEGPRPAAEERQAGAPRAAVERVFVGLGSIVSHAHRVIPAKAGTQ